MVRCRAQGWAQDTGLQSKRRSTLVVDGCLASCTGQPGTSHSCTARQGLGLGLRRHSCTARGIGATHALHCTARHLTRWRHVAQQNVVLVLCCEQYGVQQKCRCWPKAAGCTLQLTLILPRPLHPAAYSDSAQTVLQRYDSHEIIVLVVESSDIPEAQRRKMMVKCDATYLKRREACMTNQGVYKMCWSTFMVHCAYLGNRMMMVIHNRCIWSGVRYDMGRHNLAAFGSP